jgi:ATP-dependent Clp protease ATP-binding subunit ClpC
LSGNFVTHSSSRRQVAISSRRRITAMTRRSYSTSSTTTTNSNSKLTMVFERMSEDCIVALVTAQKEARKLGLKEVTNEVMLAGIVDRPEMAKSTLRDYGITWRKVSATLKTMYPTDNNGFSFFQSQTTNSDDLPFSKNLKTTMVAASKLADQMSSKTIYSQHILLALLEYTGDKAAEPDYGNEIIQCGALAVIMNSDGIDDDFTAFQFCQSLLIAMKEEDQDDELVTAGGAGSKKSKTPTLEECGVDLTQQARAGQLDPVFGRDDEIKSCLRTLVRRRKNNPCLIGGTCVTTFTCFCLFVCARTPSKAASKAANGVSLY